MKVVLTSAFRGLAWVRQRHCDEVDLEGYEFADNMGSLGKDKNEGYVRQGAKNYGEVFARV